MKLYKNINHVSQAIWIESPKIQISSLKNGGKLMKKLSLISAFLFLQSQLKSTLKVKNCQKS